MPIEGCEKFLSKQDAFEGCILVIIETCTVLQSTCLHCDEDLLKSY